MRSYFATAPLSLTFASIALVCAAGCGDSPESQATGGASSASSSTASSSSGAGGAASSSSSSSGGQMSSVNFRYTPAWSGVTAVTVIGGFGQPTDWDPTKPFATLTDDGKGNWTATATLPAGNYLYVYQVVGDAEGTPKLSRYAVDPAVSAIAPCPAASPTYSMANPNPCSQLAVPQGAAETTYHIKGVVTYDGKGIPGYLVQLDRDEMTTHHFFANRTTTLADGTFDLTTTAASVRLQVLHPTFLTKTDADRDPLALAALRRAISSAFAVSAPVTLNAAEVAYHDYGKLAPTVSATLPTNFQITVIQGAKTARVGVYGGKAGFKNIGDPWFSSPYGAMTTVAFDGTFNTKQATEMKVMASEPYYWGTWQQGPAAPAGGVQWSGESMVFPITWK